MKRSKKLQLVMMGAAPLMLAGCGKSTTEALVYKNIESCVSDGLVSETTCKVEYNRAWQTHLMTAPKYRYPEDCQQDFNSVCQQLSSGEYIPTMEGFMLSAVQQRSGGSSFTVIPLYLGRGGYYQTGSYDRIGSSYKHGKVVVDKAATVKPSIKPSVKSTTMKRGGFGSRSAARGSWGG